jgi:hypothetical protein
MYVSAKISISKTIVGFRTFIWFFSRICRIYSAFFLTVAIGNCMVKLIPPVNFCYDENIQTIFGKKLEDYNSIS